MGFVFLFIAAWAGYGIYRMVSSSRQARRYLEAANRDDALQVAHLSPPLARLVQDTRLLRVGLEAPIRDVRAFRQFDLQQVVAEDLEGIDNMLMDVSRQIADWVSSVERLSEVDRGTLEDLGVSPTTIRRALATEGWTYDRQHLHRRGMPPLDERLKTVAAELGRIEEGLQAPSRIYR